MNKFFGLLAILSGLLLSVFAFPLLTDKTGFYEIFATAFFAGLILVIAGVSMLIESRKLK